MLFLSVSFPSLLSTMIQEIIAKNMNTWRIICAHAPTDFNKVKPAVRWVIPLGGKGMVNVNS